MAITTFAELKSAIANYYARSDFGAPDDDFVTLTEARLNHGVLDGQFPTPAFRVREMEQRSTSTTSGEYLALPTDFLQAINLKVDKDRDRDLRFVSSVDFDLLLNTSLTGTPCFFTVTGEEFRFSPISTGETLEIIYYQKIPALSDTTTTNWLLVTAPNVYLYGGLLEAAIWIQEDADIVKYGRLFSGAASGLASSAKKAKYVGPLRTRSGNLPASNSVVRA